MYQLPVVLLEILKLAYFEHVSILIIRRVVEQLRNLFIFVGRNLPIRFLNFLFPFFRLYEFQPVLYRLSSGILRLLMSEEKRGCFEG